MIVAGVDVGARQLHCVWLDADGRLLEVAVVEVGKPAAGGWSPAFDRAVGRLAGAQVVAIDAPESPTLAPHARDEDASLSRKFRTARCAEIALGRERGIWVPWVTPERELAPRWIVVGFELFERLRERGVRAIEVYPHGAFRTLAALGPGELLARKTTATGRRQRIEILRRLHPDRPGLEMWSHDGLDALVAAHVALDHLRGRAQRVPAGTHEGCPDYDGSAIWLPASSAPEMPRPD